MPIYEYQCKSCGKTFSHIHKRLNEAPPPCPECGVEDVKKKFSTFIASAPAQTCRHSDSCPAMAQGGGHQCCPGCCHHH